MSARGVLQRAYAPVFFLATLAAAVVLVDAGHSKGWLLVLLGAAIAVSFLVERLLPYEEPWNHAKGDAARDAIHAAVNESLTIASTASIPLLAMLLPKSGSWPSDWPLWLQLAMAVGIADFGITLAHFASHRVEALWRLHAVHHSVERMYGFNGLMKHPLHQTIETLAGTAPLLLLGIPMDVASLLGFAVAIQLLLQHANVDMHVGRLGRFWAVAPGHRHHHIASKTRGDVNFGLFTLVWDHLLGTYVEGRPPPRDGELGVAGRPDYPAGYVDQILEPFRKQEPIRRLQPR